MAKRYTRAQWEELQASFPPRDRTPYELSPDLPGTAPSVTVTGIGDPLYSDDIFASNNEKNIESNDFSDPSIFNSIILPSDITTATIPTKPVVTGPTGDVGAKETGPTGPPDIEPGPIGPTGPTNIGPTTPNIDFFIASDGTKFLDLDSKNRYEQSLANQERAGKSAFALLESEFARFGMQSLIEPLRRFIKQGLSRDELVIELRKDPAYQNRFAANQTRIDKGLRALSEAEYIKLEDEYQEVMRRYGLPESYYKKGDLGKQEGFEKLIGFDIAAPELEERLILGKKRILESPPEVLQSLRKFYGDVIQDGDILAYVLDPQNAEETIKRKVLTSEIGAGAMQAGLGLGRERAEELGRFGITGEQSRAGYQQIAGGLERGSQLASIYREQPYGQETAEQEIFGITGAPEARKRRQRIIKSEEAAFGGQTGLTGGALSRERAGQY
jgi:hypothetical protein